MLTPVNPRSLAQQVRHDRRLEHRGPTAAERGVGGGREHDQVNSFGDRRAERLDVGLELAARGRDRGRREVGVLDRPAQPRKVLGRRGDGLPPHPGCEREPESSDLVRIRAECARRHELLVRGRDVEHRGKVYVDAELAELKAGRLALERGGPAVIVLRDREGGELRRERREALDDAALLVDRNEKPGKAALGRRGLDPLDLVGQAAAGDVARAETGSRHRSRPPLPARAARASRGPPS